MSKLEINMTEENDMLQKGYKVVEIIGKGSYGTVYKALDSWGNIYAIKAVEFSKMYHKSMRYCVTTDEFTVSSLLSNEFLKGNSKYIGIVKIYNVFRTEKHYYIVMEYLDGESIEKFVQKSKNSEPLLNENQLKSVAYQIISALAFFADLNIAHRDIKPDNIFIKKIINSNFECDYEIKIIDVGLGRISEEKPYVDMWGRRECMRSNVGTPLYASPEIEWCNGYTKRCDLWSAGMTLYYLGTGKDLVSLDVNTFRSEKKKIWEDCGKDIFKFDSIGSEKINGLLKKMMAKRGPSAKEIVADSGIWFGDKFVQLNHAKREDEIRVIDLVKECQRSCVHDFKGFKSIPLE